MFPTNRPRRLRRTATLRNLVCETRLTPGGLVMPYFVVPGEGIKREIASMPGQYHLSVDRIAAEVQEAESAGVGSVLLFGIPAHKDPTGSQAWHDQGPVQEATRRIKAVCPDVLVMADLCLCEYTSHGHCGVLQGETVANDPTLELLARTAVSQARAGADIIAPSDMMDGRVDAIRRGLDAAGFAQIAIMSYSAKYASAFYGPFRAAADSAPSFGDRRSYQMDPPNVREALREVRLDIEEGADIVMVKPALSYLDVIRAVKETFDVPVAAYSVSGEYAMVKAAARAGYVDEQRITREIHTSIVRAGADIVITYSAVDIARAVHGRS